MTWRDAVNVMELETFARANLDPMAFDYYVSGAMDEITLRENRAAFERVALRYKVMVDVSARSLQTSVLGQPLSMPVLIAPTAFHRLACDEGELATARAAGEAGTIMVLSTLSNQDVEQVAAASRGPVWFQLYVYKDRAATEALVRRAEAAGCKALVLTVDAPLLGRRERDVRNGFRLPPHLAVKNMLPAGLGFLPEEAGESGLAAYFYQLLDPALTWKDLDWLAGVARLPVLVKGVVRGDDARRALDHGAAGVIVSNHGGRQLDTSVASLDALPEVAAAMAGQGELLLDGGVRRGTDVLKALALGAKAVLLGRPILWGLGAAGQEGAAWVLERLRQELDLAFALCGCQTVADVTPDLLRR